MFTQTEELSRLSALMETEPVETPVEETLEVEDEKQEEIVEESKPEVQEEVIDDDFLDTLLEEIGYDGEEKPEFTIEGIKKAINHVVSKNKIDPTAQELNDWLSKGYSFESFRQKQEFKEIEIDESNEQHLEEIIRVAERLKGNDDEEDIEDIIEAAKDSQKLTAKAKKALDYVNVYQKKEADKIEAAEKQKAKENEEANAKTLLEISSAIGKRNLNGYSISENDGKKLQDVVTNPEKLNQIYSKLSIEQMLLLDYLAIQLADGKGIKGLTTTAQVKETVDKKQVNLSGIIKGAKKDVDDSSIDQLEILRSLNKKGN